jgi:hypothetical protein
MGLHVYKEDDDFIASDAAGSFCSDGNIRSQFKQQWNCARSIITREPEIGHPGIIEIRSLDIANGFNTLYLGDTNIGNFLAKERFSKRFIVKPVMDDNGTIRIGVCLAPDDLTHLPGMYFEKVKNDNNWYVVCGVAQQTRINTNIAVIDKWYDLYISRLSDMLVLFEIEGKVFGISNNIPEEIGMCDFFWVNTAQGVQRLYIDYWESNLILCR